MKSRTRYTGIAALAILFGIFIASVYVKQTPSSSDKTISLPQSPITQPTTSTFATYTEADWKRVLTPEQYHILREEGTEAPFTSPLLEEHRPGTFVTADCNEPVFRSEQKFDSGTGWPSFWAPITPDAVATSTDNSLFTERVEVLSKCGGHLGHVFEDGPPPTGLRYCMNGAALKFIPDEPK